MDTKKLDGWANKLLDVGKRNNLVNFKDNKSSTLEILYPNVETIFAKAESSASFEIFDPKLTEMEEDEQAEVIKNSFEEFTAEEQEQIEKDKKADYVEQYASKIKKQNMVLAYNEYTNSKTVVKSLDKKAKSHIEETGVNVAYMAFGFVHWRDSENSKYEYQAPILLTPVSFQNESAIKPYYIKMSEDDVVINPTFNYMLKAQHNITLPEYTEGDLQTYLSQVEEVIAKLGMGWTISSECKIGLFSFLKINMYEDLKNNKDKILNNNIVRALLGENAIPVDNAPIIEESGTNAIDNDLINLHSVVDADSSQIDAIKMVKDGKSFVLQGPPGTGKSQTITNIIAECLSDGKKVLFVSEKQAALNVVYDKLKKAGLSEFCLELHSYKANKKALIDELNHTLMTPKSVVSAKANSEINQKIKAQKELDQYDEELHKIRTGINKSLYQLYEAHSAYRKGAEVAYVIKDIENKGEGYAHEVEHMLESYVEYVPTVGYDYKKNPWYGCNVQDLSYENVNKLKSDLEIVDDISTRLLASSEKIASLYAIDYSSLPKIATWNNIFSILGNSSFITPSLLKSDVFSNAFPKIVMMSELSEKINAAKSYLDKSYDDDIYKLRSSELYKKLTRQYNSVFSRAFNSEYKSIVNDIKLSRKDGKRVNYAEAVKTIDNLSSFHKNAASLVSIESEIKQYLGSDYRGINTEWNNIIIQLDYLKKLVDEGVSFGKIPCITLDSYAKQKENFVTIARVNGKIIGEDRETIDRVDGYFDNNVLDITEDSLNKVNERLTGCLNEFDKIGNWGGFLNLYNSLKDYNLDKFIDITIEKNVQAELVPATFMRAFYQQWIDNIIHTSGPVLLNFNRISHDKYVKAFCEKDITQFEINKAKIRSELSMKRPSTDMISQGSALAILLREGQKKRKQMSIRKLLEETGPVVQEIKPCFLMSPLSVSTFLSSSSIAFDTVVFDEASQIFPQDAIGAIYRGTQLIVVGDSKQMPPTNFFAASIEEGETDEEEGDVNDFESILDLCSTSMPQVRLKWHYRSRNEKLITFSNKNFYDSDLVTFPSSKVDAPGIGIDYFYVGGTFDHKTGKNMKEAESVVELIYENIKRFPERSLGVVVFSTRQQDAIERLLFKKRTQDPTNEDFFSQEKPEPFFIKNLETVQGDERDTIIFSTSYAKDSQGRFVQNFGPLNRVGGERRLNVAITRAKENIQIVTSMHATDIVIGDSAGLGRKLLHDYLDYAENGEIALDRAINVSSFERFDSEFEQEVCDFLREQGITVDTQVGVSNFRIDLGISRPNTSDYVLAVECDGATYHSAKNARDRDRLRQDVLERMGWNFYRIWSTDWFKNNAVEKERLLKAATAALNGKNVKRDMSSNTVVNEAADYEEKVVERHLEFPKYVKADDDEILRTAFNQLDAIKKIAMVEAPVSEEWVLKRLVTLFGKTKVTNVVRSEYEALMRQASHYGLTRRNGFIYLTDNKRYQFRIPAGLEKRDIKYVAPEELAVGMLVFIRQNVSVNREGLFNSVAKALGFSKVTDNIHGHMDSALSLISGMVDIDGDDITLKQM